MKAIFGAFFMSAMLLASVGGASATSYIQASSSDEQLATDTKPKAVTMNSVDAKKNITVASHGGMLSSGVLLPESMFIGRYTSIYSNPSCGIDRATVPRKIPIAVAKNI